MDGFFWTMGGRPAGFANDGGFGMPRAGTSVAYTMERSSLRPMVATWASSGATTGSVATCARQAGGGAPPIADRGRHGVAALEVLGVSLPDFKTGPSDLQMGQESHLGTKA